MSHFDTLRDAQRGAMKLEIELRQHLANLHPSLEARLAFLARLTLELEAELEQQRASSATAVPSVVSAAVVAPIESTKTTEQPPKAAPPKGGVDLTTLDGGPTQRIVNVLLDAHPKKLTVEEISETLDKRYPIVRAQGGDHGVSQICYRQQKRADGQIIRAGKNRRGLFVYTVRNVPMVIIPPSDAPASSEETSSGT